MKVSIITATYNSGHNLASCMQSVLSQDYSNIEYLVIDGKSKDQTITIVKDYQTMYRNIKLLSEPDRGIYDALNKGLKRAKGDIIGFVHSDDFLADTTIISKIVAKFNDEFVVGVYGDLCYVDKLNTSKIIRYWKSSNFESSLLAKGWMPAHPTLFLKKEVYKKHGSFDLSYKIAADYDFMLRVLKDKSLKFFYLPEMITKMRVGGTSNRSIKNIIQKIKEDYRAATTNNIGGIITIFQKNISKLKQFFY